MDDITIVSTAALTVAVIAAAWDLATRRIPNVLTFGAAVAGLIVNAYLDGWAGVGQSLAGWLVGVALFFPFFALGGMGAGDVKLMGGIGALLGPAMTLWVALFSSIAGGVAAVLVAAGAGYLREAFRNLGGLVMYWRIAGIRPAPDLMLTSTRKAPRLAYAVPVLAGLMVTLWWR